MGHSFSQRVGRHHSSAGSSRARSVNFDGSHAFSFVGDGKIDLPFTVPSGL